MHGVVVTYQQVAAMATGLGVYLAALASEVEGLGSRLGEHRLVHARGVVQRRVGHQGVVEGLGADLRGELP